MANMDMKDQITTFSRTVVSSKKWAELIEKGDLGETLWYGFQETMNFVARHPRDVMLLFFKESDVNNSGIDPNVITTFYNNATQLNLAFNLVMDSKAIYEAGMALESALTPVEREEALVAYGDAIVGACGDIVKKIPMVGGMYSMLVGELESQYKKLTGLIQGHIAQIVFTELVCDYYQFNWSIDRLKKEVKNKLNLKKLDKVYAEQLYSILSMEEDLRKKAQSNKAVQHFYCCFRSIITFPTQSDRLGSPVEFCTQICHKAVLFLAELNKLGMESVPDNINADIVADFRVKFIVVYLLL